MGVLADVVRALRTTPKALPAVESAQTPNNRAAKGNVKMYRNWAEHSDWIRGAVKFLKTQVSSAKWDIVPVDFDKDHSPRKQDTIRDLLNSPNPTNMSFRTFIEPIVEDILTLDAGVVEKDRSLMGDLKRLWPTDGGSIRVSTTWDGDPEEPRYFWYPDYQERARFANDDMIYMMSNPRTYSVLGLSALETLKITIDSELNGSDYNRRLVSSAAPDGVLNLGEEARPEDVAKFKSYWLAEVAGKGALSFIGGTKNPSFIPFQRSNRDMQFLEWQNWLVKKICVVFGISPQDLGLTFDINRSTGDVQQDLTENRGTRPLMLLVQDYLTEEVVWDASFGGPANNLCFRFDGLNLKESTSKANINKLALAGVPWKTINEARHDQGLEPMGEEFDQLIMATPVGAVTLGGKDTTANIPSAREAILGSPDTSTSTARDSAGTPPTAPSKPNSQSTPPKE